MEQRATYERGVGETQDIAITANDVYNVIVAVPIITDGDVTGCVAFVGEYDEAGHVDSAAVAPLPPYPQSMVQRGDPAATEYTERYCKPREKR